MGNGFGGGSVGNAINEARDTAAQILDSLAATNQRLDNLIQLQSQAKPLTKFDIQSAPQLRTVAFEISVDTPILTVPPGMYVKINHWAAEINAPGAVRLYYAYGGNPEGKFMVDIAQAGIEYVFSNPNELVLPPSGTLFVRSTKTGFITVSLATYALTL